MQKHKYLLAILMVVLLSFAASSAYAVSPRNFRANLSGRNEVPPVPTRAQGQAVFQLSKDGSELSYKLIVANIEDVMAAHIHSGGPGVNGGVIVGLYTGGLIEGRFNGVLAQGVISEASMGEADFANLIDQIMSGNTYVNVHTSANPAGEVRGQIK